MNIHDYSASTSCRPPKKAPPMKLRHTPKYFALFTCLSLCVLSGCDNDSSEPSNPENAQAPAAPGTPNAEIPVAAANALDGHAVIQKAQKLPTAPEVNEGSGVKKQHPIIDMGATGVKATCTTEKWTESQVRDLTDVIGVNLAGTTVYPGALLQGGYLNKGQLVPVTIPRAKGSIYMTGLTLEKNARYAANDIEMNGGSVQQSIQDLLTSNEIQGTTARSSFQEDTVHDMKSFLFKIGLDGRFSGIVDLGANLNVGKRDGKSYVFSKFSQVYYDVMFEDPELSTSVFRDENRFEDPEKQIDTNNPPLYVSKVSYGRMVFFVAESSHDALEVKTALSVAVRGGPADVKLSSGLTHAEVLERARIYYYVIGGSADLALAPIKAGDPSKMFEAVKNFITDRESANFSAKNPGAPIAYTLRYLKDRTVAKMSYSVVYDKKDCDYEYPTLEPDTKVYEIPNPDEMVLTPVDKHGEGDTDFFGHGPNVDISGEYSIEDGKLVFEMHMDAQEDGGDMTRLTGSQRRVVYTPPVGWKVAEIRSQAEQSYRYKDSNVKEDVATFGPNNIFEKLTIVGNTWGDDLGKTKVTAKLNPVVIAIRPKK